MADPGTWALILAGVGTAATIAGAANQAQGAIAAGNAQRDQSQYQAAVARNNATIEDNNARYAVQAGEVSAYNESMKGRAHLGAVKAQQAANNLDVNSPGATVVRAGEAAASRTDALTKRHAAALEAYGYKAKAVNDRAQAGLYDREANYAPVAARYNAAGGLLSTASSLAFKWSGSTGNLGGGSGGSWDGPLDAYGRPED